MDSVVDDFGNKLMEIGPDGKARYKTSFVEGGSRSADIGGVERSQLESAQVAEVLALNKG